MANNQYERTLVRRPCIEHLREIIAYNQLKRYDTVYWACPPDVGKKRPYEMGLLVKDGYEKGNFDLCIIAASKDIVKVFLIEFKYGRNGYTLEQRMVADNFAHTPVEVLKIYSIDEFKEFIDRELK